MVGVGLKAAYDYSGYIKEVSVSNGYFQRPAHFLDSQFQAALCRMQI